MSKGQAGHIEFLIDPNGKILWLNLTEDYRVRAPPEQVLKAFDGQVSHSGG